MPPLAIHTQRLSRRFGQVVAVDGLDLHVPSGSIYGFLGPNGAGKTTTIRLLLGLLRPDSGEVHLLGRPLQGNRLALLRRVGALVETPALYPHLSGRENLRAQQEYVGLPRTEVERVLAIVRLERDADRLVRGYSLGMRQRLGLALALLGEPDLLILDEPTNGLDPAGIHEMRELIRGFPAQHGMTVFLSSHLLAEVEQVATHVGILGRGQLLFEGSLAALRARQRQRLWVDVEEPVGAVVALRRKGWMVTATDAGLMVDVEDDRQAPDVLATLVYAGVRVRQARLEEPSLERLFLDLTDAHTLGAPVA
jgi:ABC-2 type transport system ATP-binding protein